MVRELCSFLDDETDVPKHGSQVPGNDSNQVIHCPMKLNKKRKISHKIVW